MKKIIQLLILACLLALPRTASADAKIEDWLAQWEFNLDGQSGTLDVHDTKVDCASTPWCGFALVLTDAHGKKTFGTIKKIDDKFQHMSFTVKFDKNDQPFEAYLFSWDKTKMAGTTVWGGRTFGFSATKKANP